MTKQKLYLSDIIVLINEFNKNLINARLNNIYDINNKCFLLKFTTDNKDKKFVVIDGNPHCPRFHITTQNFDRRIIPSSFCAKLRKHLTNKKITNIQQLGTDRVVDIQFGTDNKFHIIMELYDSGNLILTDNDYKILTLVRRYSTDEQSIKVGNQYPINQEKINLDNITIDIIKNYILDNFGKEKKNSLRNVLISGKSPIVKLGKDIIYHSIYDINWNPTKKFNHDKLKEFPFDTFFSSLKNSYLSLNNGFGYIIYESDINSQKIEFFPVLFKHVETKTYLKYPSLSEALDNYFVFSSQKQTPEEKKENINKEKKNKIQKVEEEIAIRINGFNEKQTKFIDIAEYLSDNIGLFDFLSNFDPNNYNNPEILSIDKKNQTISFKNNQLENPIELDYTQNIWNNIKRYHSKKKDMINKINKTEIGKVKALTKLKETIKIKNNNENPILFHLGDIKPFWFDKFKWFITSEGYLVILGKDMNQNELLVKKYLEKTDIYLHSETHGSGSCIIKNILKNEDDIPSPISLQQAGSFIICHSKAWTYHSADKAYWVYSNQVSKIPPSGEYLPTGSFMIRGKKNYIITSLQLGFGILFKKKGEMEINNLISDITNIPDNDIDWALPILAPYQAVKNLKFKVKITPGKMRRGKAVKSFFSYFCKKKNLELKEKFYINKINIELATNLLFNGILYSLIKN